MTEEKIKPSETHRTIPGDKADKIEGLGQWETHIFLEDDLETIHNRIIKFGFFAIYLDAGQIKSLMEMKIFNDLGPRPKLIKRFCDAKFKYHVDTSETKENEECIGTLRKNFKLAPQFKIRESRSEQNKTDSDGYTSKQKNKKTQYSFKHIGIMLNDKLVDNPNNSKQTFGNIEFKYYKNDSDDFEKKTQFVLNFHFDPHSDLNKKNKSARSAKELMTEKLGKFFNSFKESGTSVSSILQKYEKVSYKNKNGQSAAKSLKN